MQHLVSSITLRRKLLIKLTWHLSSHFQVLQKNIGISHRAILDYRLVHQFDIKLSSKNCPLQMRWSMLRALGFAFHDTNIGKRNSYCILGNANTEVAKHHTLWKKCFRHICTWKQHFYPSKCRILAFLTCLHMCPYWHLASSYSHPLQLIKMLLDGL